MISLFLPLAFSAHSVSYQNIDSSLDYDLGVSAVLNKSGFTAGETLSAQITLSNFEEFQVADVYLIVQVSKGEISYPSQFSDDGILFYEKVFPKIPLIPKSNKTIAFNYALPKDISAGEYYLNLYLRTPVSLVKTGGVPSIMVSPKKHAFKVTSGTGKFPAVNIVRTKSFLYGFSDFEGSVSKETIAAGKLSKEWKGPVGAPVSAGSEVSGKFFIENKSFGKQGNLKLKVSVCEWDDSVCEKILFSKEFEAGSLEAGKEKAVDIILKAPEIPGAYAVRLELSDGARAISIYRNRLIVLGGTAKIRKLHLDNHVFGSAGDKINFNAYVGPSPDHYTNPVFENFSIELSIEDESKSKVVSEKIPIPSLPHEEQDTVKITAELESPVLLTNYFVCALIEKTGVQHDKYCYKVTAGDFYAEKPVFSNVSVSWKYEAKSKQLEIDFVQNEERLPLKINYFIHDSGGKVLVNENLEGTTPQNVSHRIEPGEYVLTVADKQKGTQEKFLLDLNESKITSAGQLPLCRNLGGAVCSESEECMGAYGKSRETEFCCTGECELKTPLTPGKTIETGTGDNSILIYLIIALAIITLIAGLIVKQNRKTSEEEENTAGENFEA